MYTYSVIVYTENTGPVELYRGTDGFRARDVYRNAVYPWMTQGTGLNRWSARGFRPYYGYRSVNIYIVCEACRDINGVFADECNSCGADID